MSARLILLNGPPAAGKSTLARRFVEDNPLALNLDIDVVRRLLGAWLDQPAEAGLAARKLALAMAKAHLDSGHAVIVPQFLARPQFIDQLGALAAGCGVAFVEVALTASRADAIAWFVERSQAPEAAAHDDAQRLVELTGGTAQLEAMYDAFRELVGQRASTRLVPVRRGDIDATYRGLLAAIQR